MILKIGKEYKTVTFEDDIFMTVTDIQESILTLTSERKVHYDWASSDGDTGTSQMDESTFISMIEDDETKEDEVTIEIRLTYNHEGYDIFVEKDWHTVTLSEAKEAYTHAGNIGCEVDFRIDGKPVQYWSEAGRILRK